MSRIRRYCFRDFILGTRQNHKSVLGIGTSILPIPLEVSNGGMTRQAQICIQKAGVEVTAWCPRADSDRPEVDFGPAPPVAVTYCRGHIGVFLNSCTVFTQALTPNDSVIAPNNNSLTHHHNATTP